jgi:anti-sigma B factor antagonist
MKIETEDRDGIQVVRLEGRIDANTTTKVEEKMFAMVDEGVTRLVINFEKLDFISSAGLRTLLSTAKRVREAKGDLKVCNLNSNVQEVFDITGFSTLFSVSQSEDEALASF